MFVKGYYKREIIEFRKCDVYVERGKLHRVSLEDASPILASSYVPNSNSEFTLERLPKYNTGLIPSGSNYLLEFIGKSGNHNRIYLSLNKFKAFKVKWVLRQYLIQSKDMKVDVIKYIIGAIIGAVITGVSPLIFGTGTTSNDLPKKKEDNNSKMEIKKSIGVQEEILNKTQTVDTVSVDSVYGSR